MKASILLSTLCLAPLALAAPFARFPTLVTVKADRWALAAAPPAALLHAEEQVQRVILSSSNRNFPFPSSSSTTSKEESSSPMLDVDPPKTTHELMQKTAASSPPPQPYPTKPLAISGLGKPKAVSVGTLVFPGAQQHASSFLRKLYNPATTPRYLIPAEYVEYLATQRVEMLMVGLIMACVLAVMVVEMWEVVADCVTSVFRRREGRIRLGDERLEECESDFSDDDCDAPFGGYRHRDGRTSLKLPEKVDEKDACI